MRRMADRHQRERGEQQPLGGMDADAARPEVQHEAAKEEDEETEQERGHGRGIGEPCPAWWHCVRFYSAASARSSTRIRRSISRPKPANAIGPVISACVAIAQPAISPATPT